MLQQATRPVVASAFWYLPNGEFMTCQPIYEGESVDSYAVYARASRSAEILNPRMARLFGLAKARVYPSNPAPANINPYTREPS